MVEISFSEFETLPNSIRETERILINLIDEIESIKESNSRTENLMKYDIATVKDKDDKLVFSNDLKRDIELQRRLKESELYQGKLKSLSEKVKQKSEVELELSFLKRRFIVLEVFFRGTR